MSDQAMHISGAVQSTEAISLEEHRAYADANRDGRPALKSDVIEELLAYARRVIEQANLPHHNRMMATTKLDELVFWVRAGMARRE